MTLGLWKRARDGVKRVIAQVPRGRFMRMARKRKKSTGRRGLVKKSAMLSAVRTYGTVIAPCSTSSRIHRWRLWMCFVRSWCSGL